MRGQYPPISQKNPCRRTFAVPLALSLALALGVLGGCTRPILLVLLDPLFVTAEPEAAARLSRFRLTGYESRVELLDPLATTHETVGVDIAIVSPLALAALADSLASSMPSRLFAIDASMPAGFDGKLSMIRFDRSPAWKAAGALAAAYLDGEGKAAILVVEGRGRSRLRTADFSDGMRGAGGAAPLALVLDAEAGPEDLDRAIDSLLGQDLRLVALSAGALTPRAARRLHASGIVIVSDQNTREAAFWVEDDYEAALDLIAAAIAEEWDELIAPSRLRRGQGFGAAATRNPSLLPLAKGLPRAYSR